eukprot:555441-Amphidinium_carterae.1
MALDIARYATQSYGSSPSYASSSYGWNRAPEVYRGARNANIKRSTSPSEAHGSTGAAKSQSNSVACSHHHLMIESSMSFMMTVSQMTHNDDEAETRVRASVTTPCRQGDVSFLYFALAGGTGRTVGRCRPLLAGASAKQHAHPDIIIPGA